MLAEPGRPASPDHDQTARPSATPSPPHVQELCDAFSRVRDKPSIGVVLFTGVGAADGGYALLRRVTRAVRAMGGYLDSPGLPRLKRAGSAAIDSDHCEW